MAMQLAKKLGAYVVGTATGEHVAELRALGADEIIDYRDADVAEGTNKFDIVLDLAVGELLQKAYALVKKGGLLLSTTQFPDAGALENYEITGRMTFTAMDDAAFQQLFRWIEAGWISIKKPLLFTLDQAAEALLLVEERRAKSKLVYTF